MSEVKLQIGKVYRAKTSTQFARESAPGKLLWLMPNGCVEITGISVVGWNTRVSLTVVHVEPNEFIFPKYKGNYAEVGEKLICNILNAQVDVDRSDHLIHSCGCLHPDPL